MIKNSLWWLHGISAEQIESLPLQLPCALTTNCIMSHVWENILALSGSTSMPSTSLLLVFFIKENDKQLPAGSQQTTRVKDFSEVFHPCLKQSHLSLKGLMRFCGSRDVNLPVSAR